MVFIGVFQGRRKRCQARRPGFCFQKQLEILPSERVLLATHRT